MKRKPILKDLARNYLKHTKSESGITLIALVVTIVVLLILAGVTISLVLGENGILTQAKKAKFKNEQSDVLEATQIYAGDYEIEKNTQATNGTIINYLNEKNIIDSNNIINVEALLKKKLSTGQGTGNSDVYVIEQNSNKEYIVVYYDKEGNKTELGILGKEVEEVADEKFFYIDKDGALAINYNYYGNVLQIENLILPAYVNGVEVTKICSGFFIEENNTIKSIKIPESVTSIGYGAFSRCTSLQKINIPEKTTNIEYINQCNRITLKQIDVAENNPNYSSKDGVLFDKTGETLLLFPSGKDIKAYEIPETVTSIGESAFSVCISLQSINIPEKVTTIGDGAFLLSLSLKEITVDENNPNYSSKDGVLFDKTGKTLLRFPSGKDIKAYEIPETVTSIGENAFSVCISLQSINIPEKVTTIGYGAFALNLSLKEITVDENNPNYSSKDGVLFDKTGKTLLLFPTCKEIETYEIPAETTTIGSGAFTLYPSEYIDMILKEFFKITDIKLDTIPMLKRVNIPNTVTTVEEMSFLAGNTEQTIKVPFSSETTRPAGWNENWTVQESFMANIEYTEQ